MNNIQFNVEMTKAILDSHKTQTRRPLKLNIIKIVNEIIVFNLKEKQKRLYKREFINSYSKYKIGETVWIREPAKSDICFLKIIDVRVERLNDIGLTGIRSEGADDNENILEWWINLWNKTAKDGFKWDDNPYVFVYEFERVYK